MTKQSLRARNYDFDFFNVETLIRVESTSTQSLNIRAASRALAGCAMRQLLGVVFASWIVQMALLWLHHAG